MTTFEDSDSRTINPRWAAVILVGACLVIIAYIAWWQLF
jgi:hypothetical protein